MNDLFALAEERDDGDGGEPPGMFAPDFTEWLDKQRLREDPVGDLARDARRDWDWPFAGELGVLHRHLDEMEAIDDAHRALDAAWREWERETRRSPA